MKFLATILLAWSLQLLAEPSLQARVWTDATGAFTMEAELIAFNERSVVLQRADHELVAIPVQQLSEQDRKYLASEEGGAAARKEIDRQQTWTLRDGTTIVGRLVDYASQDLTIQRRRRRIYVDDRPLDNLPKFYQQVVPAIVAHFENLPRADRRGLQTWLARQDGQSRTFKIEGVVLEADNGDEFAIPFFLFSDEDLAVLEPGWDESLAARRQKDFRGQQDQAFFLQSLAAARSHDALVQHEIALMQLKLQAVEVGLTSLWEVTLYPAAGNGSPPLWVVVAGRDSRQATETALQQNPGFIAGPVRRVTNR